MRRQIPASLALALTLTFVGAGVVEASTSRASTRHDPVAQAHASAAPVVVTVPSTIDRTGRSDVTAALNAFFAGVPNGRTITFPPKSRYRIEGTLLLLDRQNLTIDGNGATFFAKTNGNNTPPRGCSQASSVCRYPNRTRSQWSFNNDVNMTVRNLVVIGSANDPGPQGTYDPSLEAQHAFNIVGASGMLLDHVVALNVWGDLVYVGGIVRRDSIQSSTDVLVSNSVFVGSSRQGWSVTDGIRITFVNNVIDRARRSLIDIEANTATDHIEYVTIKHNLLGRSRFCTISNYGAPAVEHDFVFADNRTILKENLAFCFQGYPSVHRSNYQITGNTGVVSAPLPNDPMVRAAYIDHLTVTNNRQYFSMLWPHRSGAPAYASPQGPVTTQCSTTSVSGNAFGTLPRWMHTSISKGC
jgi:hypothetical protein